MLYSIVSFVSQSNVSIAVSLIYLLTIYSLNNKNVKSPFKVIKSKKPLIIWSFVQFIFSLVCCCAFIPRLYFIMTNYNFHISMCYEHFMQDKNSWTATLSLMFLLMKFGDLIESILLVLMQRQLLFIHWFHHVMTLILTNYLFHNRIGCVNWFVTTNSVVHLFMYLYFTLKTLGFKFNRVIPSLITMLQIIQFIICFTMTFYYFISKYFRSEQQPFQCQHPGFSVEFSFSVYLIYLILFIKLYYRNKRKTE